MREDKDVIRADPFVRSAAKKIFGETYVREAYVTTWDMGSTSEELEERLGESSRDIISGSTESFPLLCSQNILIEFCDGRLVQFCASEWCSIRRVSIGEFRLIPYTEHENELYRSDV